MSFENIVGNDSIKTFLNKIVEENHIVHSYLFVGIEGIGKRLFAKEFARKLLCFNQEDTEDCLSCIKFKTENHPDFFQIEPENNIIKIAQIRDMQEKIAQKPITSKRKVYFIMDSDTMTKEAQNCLLKTLEEPPEYATIILTSSNESKLLNTIKSRCMKVSLKEITEEQIETYGKETLGIPIENKFIKASGGSIGKAIRLQEEKERYEQIDEILQELQGQDLITILNKADVLEKEKEKIQEILEYMLISLYHTKDRKKQNCIVHIEETKRRIAASSNYTMCIDYLLMKLWEELNEKYSRSSI